MNKDFTTLNEQLNILESRNLKFVSKENSLILLRRYGYYNIINGYKEEYVTLDENGRERYFYPAIFTYEDDQEISIEFPDLNCATSGVDDHDALLSARELLGCVLFGMEEDGEIIPSPTPLSKIITEPNERVVLVDVYMPSIRQANVNRSVNRTVTLPAWLNSVALEHNINFSQVLQDALKTQLNLK